MLRVALGSIVGGFHRDPVDQSSSRRRCEGETRRLKGSGSRIKVQVLGRSAINGVGDAFGSRAVGRRGNDWVSRLTYVTRKVLPVSSSCQTSTQRECRRWPI